MDRPYRFLDLFFYQSTVITNRNKFYQNCLFIKNFGSIRQGQQLDLLHLSLSITGWENDNVTIDESSQV